MKLKVVNWCLFGCLLVLLAYNYFLPNEQVIKLHQPAVVTVPVGYLLAPTAKATAPVPLSTLQTEQQQLANQINAQAFIALDSQSKQILAAKNITTQYYPASTTKILTALTARQIYPLNQELTITADDLRVDNTLGVAVGETFTVNSLLQALLINSANEVGLILANHSPNGYDGFMRQLNVLAQSYGLQSSHFVNPQGFDHQDQQTSAFDLALVSLILLKDDYLTKIVATPATVITDTAGKSFPLTNTNQLLTQALPYQVKGIKTGTTDLANQALVSLLSKDGQEIVVVVLSTNNRYNDTKIIADYLWQRYQWSTVTNLWQNQQK